MVRRKNQGAVEVCSFKQRHEEIEFLFRRHGINRVRDGFRRCPLRTDLDRFGISQDPGRKPLNFRRERGGKEQRLAIGRDLFDYPAHVWEKPHVEHAIDFVEHENIHFIKTHRALLKMIEETARRRDDDVGSGRSFLALFAVADAAMHERNAQICKAPVIAKRRFDLRGQLAGWLEHQTTKRAVLREIGQNREREGRGFPGAGLCGADQVLAGKNNREGAVLDRRGIGKSHRLRSANDLRRKAKVFE